MLFLNIVWELAEIMGKRGEIHLQNSQHRNEELLGFPSRSQITFNYENVVLGGDFHFASNE